MIAWNFGKLTAIPADRMGWMDQSHKPRVQQTFRAFRAHCIHYGFKIDASLFPIIGIVELQSIQR